MMHFARVAARFMDATAPGLLLAQGIGRIGNWWNQELYGKPTTLPWGLKIDLDHRAGIAPQYLNAKAYQPTFLYELLWDLAGVALLLWLDRRRSFRPVRWASRPPPDHGPRRSPTARRGWSVTGRRDGLTRPAPGARGSM